MESMERFDAAVKFTLGWEGGYIWDIDDAGGESKFGISKRQYPDLDIYNLTEQEAIEIYRRDYWKPYHEEIRSPQLAIRLFDLSVNMGHLHPNKMLQQAANKQKAKLKVDGELGPLSIRAINQCDEYRLYTGLCLAAKRRYEELARKGNNQKFLKDWMNRLNDPILLDISLPCLLRVEEVLEYI